MPGSHIYHSFLIIAVYLSSVVSSNNSVCHEVRECQGDPVLKVEKMSYEIITDSWSSVHNHICPRSDSSVPQWLVAFKDRPNNAILPGSFCSVDEVFNASDVCTKSTGELVFHNSPSSFQGTDDVLEFKFSTVNDTYETSFIIRYATTNVYSDQSTVYFVELGQFAALNWYIYHPDTNPSVKIYYNSQVLMDSNIELDSSKYSVFSDALDKCIKTSTSDSTIYYTLFVFNPTSASSAGEYVLVVDTYSATVTLVPQPSVSVSSITPSSNMLQPLSSLTSSSSITASSESFQQSPTSSLTHLSSSILYVPAVTSSSSADNIVFPVVISVVILFLLLALVVLAIIMTIVMCTARRKTSDIEKSEDKVEEAPAVVPHTFIQQFSQDPSIHKYHLPNDLNKDLQSDIKVADQFELEETNQPPSDRTINKSTSMLNTSPTTSSASLHETTVSPRAPQCPTSTVVEHPRVTHLKHRDSSTSLSLPSSPRMMPSSKASGARTSEASYYDLLSQSYTELHRERNHILKQVKIESEKSRELKQQLVDSLKDLKESSLHQLDLVQSISSGIVQETVVLEQDDDADQRSKGKDGWYQNGVINQLNTDYSSDSIPSELGDDADSLNKADQSSVDIFHSTVVDDSSSVTSSSEEQFRNNLSRIELVHKH